MRKLLISTIAAVAALGLFGAFVPMAAATVAPPPTDEVAGYPPVPATDEDEQEQAGPVVITPAASAAGAGAAGAAADLPSTGSDSMMPLQVAGGLLVAGVLVVFAVRRRRHASPEPAA